MAQSVKIWTTATCPYCKMTKEFLTQKGVEFQNFDVTQDKEALDELKKISGGLSVPVIVVDENAPVVGFKKEELEKLLSA